MSLPGAQRSDADVEFCAGECTVLRLHGKSKATRAQWPCSRNVLLRCQLRKRHPDTHPRPFVAAGRWSQAGSYGGCGDRHDNQRKMLLFMCIKSEIYSIYILNMLFVVVVVVLQLTAKCPDVTFARLSIQSWSLKRPSEVEPHRWLWLWSGTAYNHQRIIRGEGLGTTDLCQETHFLFIFVFFSDSGEFWRETAGTDQCCCRNDWLLFQSEARPEDEVLPQEQTQLNSVLV